MATISDTTSVPLPTTNNYELDYSPPNSNTSTLKQKFNQISQNNNNNNKFNVASAMVVNQGMNYTYASPNAVNSNTNDSGFENSTFGTPNSLGNNSTGNVNNIASNFTNLSFTNSKELNQNLINNFGQNNNIGFSASGLSSAQHAAGMENKCLRCGHQVYALERIGPIKGNIYHKTCFKCLVCDRQLDLKTYYTNQVDLNERQIYCQSHAPKSGKGVFGADNIYIHNILNAPKLDVMQKVDNKPKANIDGSARHIMHAMHAQHLVQMGNRKENSQVHRFPAYPQMNPANLKAREAIRKAQEILEQKQRAEEDMLLQKFRDERAKEEKKLEQEVKDEWEKRLQLIQSQYEQDLQKKKDQKEISQRLRKEQEDLEKNMTLKREKKREEAKRTLMQLEQEATANLVTKHSEEMLKMIKAKEAEVAALKAREANLANSENSDPSNKDFDSTNNTTNSLSSSKTAQISSGNVYATPPPPQPPVRRKRDLYDDPCIFEYIDEQAINVAESEQTSYTELVDQLTFGLITDLEKARAIFRWITVKDLNAIEFGETLTADTPLGLLRGIKFGTETYHTLFMRLCSYAGMHCVDIKGHSKSVGYEPGMKIQPGKFTNTWNAVLIDGEWRFVQCNWGARHLVMSKDKKVEPTLTKPSRDKIKYQYDEHYFLPDPEEFILEFFPHNSEWQLLEQPITLDEFESLPFVRSLFFHYHLDFVNQRQAVIFTNSRGACDIKLRMPEDLKSRLAFHFHLRLANKEDNEINGIKLERYVLHTIQDDLVSFNVHVPQIAEYFIEIFASLVESDTNPFGQSFKLKCVCKYKITCEELSQRMHPLPACASGEWGPMKAQRHFNIVPLTFKNAIIEAQHQILELKFDLPKPLKIHGKLHNNTLNEIDKLVKHETNPSNPLQLTIYVTLPDEGQFGLDIYARDPEYQSEKRTMSHCCKYLINFNKKNMIASSATSTNSNSITTTATTSNQLQYMSSIQTNNSINGASLNPKLPSSDQQVLIGPNTEILAELGMVPISHVEPVIKLDDQNTQVDLQFKMSKAVDFSFDLKYSPVFSSSSNTSTQSLSNYTQLKASENVKVKQYGYTISFSVSLPLQKYGSYLFTVYASDDQNKTKNLPAVYTYLIKFDKKNSPINSASSSFSNNASPLTQTRTSFYK